jgi:hypothetical protein
VLLQPHCKVKNCRSTCPLGRITVPGPRQAVWLESKYNQVPLLKRSKLVLILSQVSNIADQCYLGIQAMLATFNPLLRSKRQSSKATLVALFLNAVKEVHSGFDEIVPLEGDMARM